MSDLYVLYVVVQHLLTEGLPATLVVTLVVAKTVTPGGERVAPKEFPWEPFFLDQLDIVILDVGPDEPSANNRVNYIVVIENNRATEFVDHRHVILDDIVPYDLGSL